MEIKIPGIRLPRNYSHEEGRKRRKGRNRMNLYRIQKIGGNIREDILMRKFRAGVYLAVIRCRMAAENTF